MVSKSDIGEGTVVKYESGGFEEILSVQRNTGGEPEKVTSRFISDGGEIVQSAEVFLAFADDFGGTVVR